MNGHLAKGICILLALGLMACMGRQANAQLESDKTRGEIRMKTYYMGRFCVDIPEGMKEGRQSQSLRDHKITEMILPDDKDEKKRFLEEKWRRIIDKADKHEKDFLPRDKTTAIVQKRDFPEIGPWAKGVLYYEDSACESGFWDVLIDRGKVAILLEIPRGTLLKPESLIKSINNLTKVGAAYKVRDRGQAPPRGDYFYMQNGVIALPFLWHERLHSVFINKGLYDYDQNYDFIRIEMDSTFTGQKYTVSDNMAATIGSGFAFAKGVKVDRLRFGKRTVAGLEGQEELNRLADKGGKDFHFSWEHIAKTNSGEAPGILISLKCPDNGDEKERLKIWDAVLNSMKPMYERK
jgi:hypothetical protein